MTIRALTMLNESGDSTLTWTPDRDEAMEAIIEKKMAEGVSFFIIEPRFGGRMPLKTAAEARNYRALAIPDEDFAKFVEIGNAEVVKTPAAPVKTVRKANSAKEVATSESVGVRPMKGG